MRHSTILKNITVISSALILSVSCHASEDKSKPGEKSGKEVKTMEGKSDAGKFSLSEPEKKELLKIARETVETLVKTGRIYKPKVVSAKFRENGAVFVTLKKHGDLRGCIGDVIAHQPLVDSVVGNAINAASKDPRFNPVEAGELKDIDIEISVLTPFQPVSDPKEIIIGKDGLMLTRGWNRGVFLPQVPVEWKWNLQEYLDHLCGKAGLPPGCWKDAKLEKFQAIVFGEKE